MWLAIATRVDSQKSRTVANQTSQETAAEIITAKRNPNQPFH
jgi:hypothetical protein